MVPVVRRRLGLGTLGLAVALSAVAVQPVVSPVAAPAAAEPARKVDVSPRSDAVSAMVAAQSAGQRVEDLSQGDAFTQVFANPDGTWTTESASEPVRAQDDKGTWAPIDLTLVKFGGRLVPKNAPGELSLSAGGDKVFADVVPDDGPGGAGKVSWSWPSELPEPVLDGASATYRDVVAGGGDLVVTATASGFTHNVVLDERPKAGADGKIAPIELTVPVATPGAEVRTNAAGGIEVTAKAKGGKSPDVVAAAPPPIMWDSSAPGPQDTNASATSGDPAVELVSVSVVDTAAGGRLVLKPDMAFLTDPETVYPVTVDPQFTLYSDADTWVSSNYPSGQGSSSVLRAGTADGTSPARSFLKFPGEATWNGTQVRGAVLKLWNYQSGSCSAGAIRAARITGAWSPTTLTWTNQPAASLAGTPITYSPAHGASGCAAAEAQWSVTDIVQGWADGSIPNYGLQLRAYTETNPNTWRGYWSADSSGGIQKPRLIVTYNRYPSTPTSLQVAPSPDGAHVSSTTPTLSAVVTDPDGGQVAGYFEVKQGTDLKWSGTSPMVASGGTASVEVPAGKLTDGGQYTVTVRGEDGVAARSKTAASTTVTVDTNVPDVIVTSNVFTNGTWTNTLPNSATTTLNGSADTTAFLVDYDGVKANINANSSGDATMPYTPTAGWHVLDVTPIDAAGNYGPKVTFAHGTGAAAFTTPAQWTPSTASFPIDLSSRPSATGATLQWRIAGKPSWTTAAKVKKADGSDWAGGVTGSSSRSTTGSLVWNASEEKDGTTLLITAPALLEIRGCFQYSGTAESCSSSMYVGLFASAFGGRFPTTEIGPAEVALFNGEARIGDADAADSTAGIGRTFSTLSDGSLSEGVFGPGWSDPSVLTANSSATTSILDNRAKDGTFVVVDAGGGSQIFKASGGEVYRPVEPTGDATTLTLTPGTPDTLALSRPLGTGSVVTTWEWKSSDLGGEPAWTLKASSGPGSGNSVAVNSTGRRPTFVRQSAPAAASACSAATQTVGCRALRITYTGSGSSTRVSKIERIIGANEPTSVVAKTLAEYTYAAGKLTKVCGPDPDGAGTALPLCTEYTYATAAGRTMLATLKPAGLTQWRFAYDSIGRLLNVKRERPATSGGGDATWSIDYGLSLTASGLPDMTPAKIGEWGQEEVPTKVYAVYQPSSNGAEADVSKANLFYTTNSGATTNTAAYGPDGWLVNTSWFDSRGNVVQQLDATGWARVQAAPAAERLRTAAEASSFTVFNTWGDTNVAGTRVVDEYGPAHTSTLENDTVGLFRVHNSYVYDDSPGVDPSLLTGRPNGASPGLVVKSIASTSTAGRAADYDVKVTTYGYARIVAGDGDGWVLGMPTSTSSKVDGSAWSTSISRFDASGQEIETRQPGGGADGSGAGNDAHSTFTTYYTADGSGACGGKPAWDGLVCRTGPAAQPAGTTIPVTYNAEFDDDLNPTIVQEISGGDVQRTSAMTYDELGRKTSTSVTVSGNGASADTVGTTYGYAPSTGLPTTETASAGSSGTITTSYDEWGREIGYVDAAGSTSAVTYEAAGRISTNDTGATTTSYTYDAHGFLTGAAVSGVGSFGYEYAADGSVKDVSYPNGISASYQSDEIRTAIGIRYTDSSGPLLAFTANSDARGRTLRQNSPASSQSFTYDGIDRLTKVADVRGEACVTRSYGFGSASERESLSSYGPGVGGACQSSTPTTSRNSAFDDANRITDAGYSYDALGRTLTVPAIDTAGEASGSLDVGYRANDMVGTLTQHASPATGGDTNSTSYALDPASRVSAITYVTNGSEVKRLRYRYADGGDSPASVETSSDAGTTWVVTRYLKVPGLGLAGEIVGNSVTFSVVNPHGDIVANFSSAGAVDSYAESDEYGNALAGAPARRYGWLGARQRASDAIGGLTLMGARVYNPKTGAFLTPDPVHDGGDNLYGYPVDPINQADDSGGMWATYEKSTYKVNAGACTNFGVTRAVFGCAYSGVKTKFYNFTIKVHVTPRDQNLYSKTGVLITAVFGLAAIVLAAKADLPGKHVGRSTDKLKMAIAGFLAATWGVWVEFADGRDIVVHAMFTYLAKVKSYALGIKIGGTSKIWFPTGYSPWVWLSYD